MNIPFSRLLARFLSLVAVLWISEAAAAPRTYAIDGAASNAAAHVGKTGVGSFAGHEHTIAAQLLQGEVVLDPEALAQSSVDIRINTRSLKVSPEGEPEGDAAKVQQAMRGPKVLDVARHATIQFRSREVTGKQVAPGSYELAIAGELSLHGVKKAFTVPVQLTVKDEAITATGKMVVKQSDFGIEPTTAAGGLVKVEDEVTLTFQIVARVAAK